MAEAAVGEAVGYTLYALSGWLLHRTCNSTALTLAARRGTACRARRFFKSIRYLLNGRNVLRPSCNTFAPRNTLIICNTFTSRFTPHHLVYSAAGRGGVAHRRRKISCSDPAVIAAFSRDSASANLCGAKLALSVVPETGVEKNEHSPIQKRLIRRFCADAADRARCSRPDTAQRR